ncbi:glycosyltransferase family 2 protein [Peribacillus sp. NPDC058075]|uniref:glycosyltransferase family 2 protein n=1 Tax=unclassified Peribacillus TaxID=2675266 RepID=UPI0036DDD9DC
MENSKKKKGVLRLVINKTIGKSETNPEKPKNHIEVSIIIPSYNKYPLNQLTLYALEKQTFDPDKMEVIFINDASTDETRKQLKSYNPPYNFKLIHFEQNQGRAKIRNVGIQAAKGDILIFLDAEMLTKPDFVENHFNYHKSQKNLIVSGAMFCKSVYTCIYPNFKQEQLKEIENITKSNSTLHTRYKNYVRTNPSPYPLIGKNEISNQVYKNLINRVTWFSTIIKEYGENLSGFQFPWMAFLTGNVSIRKELLMQTGGFDEDFVGYGYEDWELGYRLYKVGAKYLVKKNVISYHQEHPIGENNWKQAMKNYNVFIRKHPDIDILFLSLEIARFTDVSTMNKMLSEYKLFISRHPNEFQAFHNNLREILKTSALLLQIDIRHFNVLGAAGFDSNKKEQLLKDINTIKKLKKYPHLTHIIEKVIKSK